MLKHGFLIIMFLPAGSPGAAAAVSYYSSSDYRSRSDNPFYSGLLQEMMYLEDFEHRNLTDPPYNFLTTPYAQGWNGTISGSPDWGVQEDFADGSLGYQWSSSGGRAATTELPVGIHFNFFQNSEGRLPEYAGAALLGRGLAATGPDFNVILVYDAQGREVTNGEWRIPKPNYDLPYNQEDLFLNFEGIYVQGGISSIHFRDFLEVDHLTYGYAIPEISTGLLTLAAGTLILARRSRSGTTSGN